MSMKNIVVAISGPSGVGKGTLVKRLVKEHEDIALSVSCTTRAPREGEVNGREYFFLTKEEFLSRVQAGDFLEYDEHFGNYYGTPRPFVLERLKDKSVVLEIDVRGAMNAKKQLPDAVTVFIAPPSEEELLARLKGRNTESEEEIQKRLSRLRYETEFQKDYDFTIVNDDLERAYKELCDIIDKARQGK